MLRRLTVFCLIFGTLRLLAQSIACDLSKVQPGPITVVQASGTLAVSWRDGDAHDWVASFSLEQNGPLIRSIAADGRPVIEDARPVYRVSTGTRVGGWDNFFDSPPLHPEGTRSFAQNFHPTAVTAKTVGDRLEVTFNGLRLGPFHGSLRYDFYPGTSLVQQEAILRASEPDTAYLYDAGLQMAAQQDRRPGLNMATQVQFYDPATDVLQTLNSPYGSERHTLQVRYRALAAKTANGSVAAFPSPHRYLFARDYSTNLGFAWYSAWRGQVSLGIQQPPDDNTGIYAWINAPPESDQEMGIFFLLSPHDSAAALEKVKEYTHADRFPHLDGFITFAPHWHFAFTEQQVTKGSSWAPPFKEQLERLGIDAAMIMDFHGDGHPQDLGETRLRELRQYFAACRAQTNRSFLLIPSEEADVIQGGHWGLVFPKPVFWFQDRRPGEPFKTTDQAGRPVYRVHSPEEIWAMITAEHGLAYQTHPRTKGSTGYPDKILDSFYFKDPRYLGVGWKAMPSELSSPRLGERGLKVLDDLNNLGLHKLAVGEVDLFQTDAADELYSQMNVNYLKLSSLPDFDHYGQVLDSLSKGDGFISTGEVMLPSFSIVSDPDGTLAVKADVSSTFPLRLAEIVWGDGLCTHYEILGLTTAREFARHWYTWKIEASKPTWARLALWDIAGGGAFTNPIWFSR